MEKNIMGDFYMKYIAQYNGKKYDASFQSETEIIIRSNDEMDLKNGFQKYENIFFKIVNKSDLEQLYEEHLYGTYKGIEFSINGETEKTYQQLSVPCQDDVHLSRSRADTSLLFRLAVHEARLQRRHTPEREILQRSRRQPEQQLP